jgi:AcrR family transcriptional regulator
MTPRPRTAPRKRPVQERSRVTVDAILDATARVLVKEGYDRASTNRIALAAGVSVGSLYQYFPSKEALVAALMDRHMNEMFGVFEEKMARLAQASLEDAAHEIVHAMVDAHAVDPKLHRVLIEQVPRFGRLARMQEVEERASVMVRAFLEARRAEIRPKNLELATFLVIEIVESLSHVAVLSHPELLGEALADEIADVILRYLKDGEPRRRHS